LVRVLYFAISACLAIYGFQALVFTVIYLHHRRERSQPPDIAEDAWPRVAVQLPIYNERYVVERLIDAAAGLDYPRDRLEVQVLDDSSDDTTQIAEARARYHRERGVDVRVLHRTVRSGYKAGALAHGLAQTDAEYAAIFDADFRPEPDFLHQVVPHLAARPELGAVQVRWSHLNDIYSPLTRAQGLMLDGHFVIEQTARNRAGLLMCFNGSGGVWRRTAILDAGGWQSDTMTEDMDLSYRAQLAGWRILFLPDVAAPAELPPQMEAFKQQQARWAQGSMQCLRKTSGRVLHSRQLSLTQKLMSLLHMSAYLSQPLMIGLLLVTLPIIWQARPLPLFFAVLGLAGIGPPLLFAVAQCSLYPDWRRRLLYMPVLAVVGVGIAPGITRAVFQGLTSWGGTFRRTPKFRLEGRQGRWAHSFYRLLPDRIVIGELLLAVYAGAAAGLASLRGDYGAVPFLLVYALGFGLVAYLGLFQGGWRGSMGHS